jgi:hypothetical protein
LEGYGINRAPSGDAVKFVDAFTVTGTDCALGKLYPGTIEITDLGPDDLTGATSAIAAAEFTSEGSAKVCYRPSGGFYTVLPFTITVIAQTQTGITNLTPTTVKPRQTQSFTLEGHGINRYGDSIKFVDAFTVSDTDCSLGKLYPGTFEITDLGPDDLTDTTWATADAIFYSPGSAKVCYKPSGGFYTALPFTITIPYTTHK